MKINNKFAIKDIKNSKWLNLDFRDGTEIIYTKDYIDAYHFNTTEDARNFLKEHNLHGVYELYELKVFAQPICW